MKSNALFILIYSLSFFTLSMLSVTVFDRYGGEMFGFCLWGNVIYLPLSIFSWILIQKGLSLFSNIKGQIILKFLFGLIVLNLFVFFAGGSFISLRLFTYSINSASFGISFIVHCVYAISFVIASMCVMAKNRKPKSAEVH